MLIAVCFLRSLVLTLILITVAGPYRNRTFLDPIRWIVVRDTSASMPADAGERAEKLIGRMQTLEPEVELEEIRFGRSIAPGHTSPRPPGDASDVRPALQWSRARIRPDRRNRVVFLTDGRFSRHLLPSDWPALPAGSATTYRVEIPPGAGPDPCARALLLPPRIDEGAPFHVEARFVSDQPAEGVVRLLGPTEEEKRLPVRFTEAGEQVICFRLEPLQQGRHALRLVLEVPDDREPGNNVLEATLRVGPKPGVLVVDEAPRSGGSVRAALEAQGFFVAVKSDFTRSDLEPLRAVLLRNRRTSLSPAAMEALLAFVETEGGGLLIMGGPRGQGLYGYVGTPLEQALPLTPLPPPTREKPGEKKPDNQPPGDGVKKPGNKSSVFESKGKASSITLLLLIDKSGSMGEVDPSLEGGISPIQLAKEAAIATAETLSPEDRIGIIAFDDRTPPFLVVPLGPAGKRPGMTRRVSRLKPGSGTLFMPALVMASNLMQRETSRIKHVILLTDGNRNDAERGLNHEFKRIVRRMTDRKITLSTVGVGGADLEFVQSLSRWGKGQNYWATSADEIPRLYSLESDRLLARAGRKGKRRKDLNPEDRSGLTPGSNPGRQPPETRPSRPAPAPVPLVEIPVHLTRAHPALIGLPDSFPPIHGLDATRPRTHSWVGLETTRSAEAVLASGPFGLGRVMVLTTDLGGTWTKRWPGWKGFSRMAAQVMRYLARPPGPRPRLPRDGRKHGPELDLTGNDAFGLARLEQVTGAAPLPPLEPGPWPGEESRSEKEPMPLYGLLLAVILLVAEIMVRRVGR